MDSTYLKENFCYYYGDTLDYWIGPNIESDPDFRRRLEKIFQKANKIGEVTNRLVRVLVGKQPNWNFSQDLEEPIELEETERMLRRWLEKQLRATCKGHVALNMKGGYYKHDKTLGITRYRAEESAPDWSNPLQKATRDALVCGYGYLRLWSPQRFRTAPDPAMRIAIHSPNPGAVELVYDDDNLLEEIRYKYQRDGRTYTERQQIDPVTGQTLIWEEDEQGNLLIETDEQGNQREAVSELDLNGNYTIQVIQVRPLITDSLKRLQNAINYYLTLMPKNQELAGFRERVLTNAQPPGDYEEHPDGTRVFKPDPNWSIGPGKISWITGIPIYNELGQVSGYSNPGVNYAEPASPETFIQAVRATVALLYEEVAQGHLLSSDLQISGVSRQQLRADFWGILEEYQGAIEAAWSGALESAAGLMGMPLGEETEIVTNLVLSQAEPTPEEMQALIAEVQAGLESRKGAIARRGERNPEAKLEEILEEESREAATVLPPAIPEGDNQ